MDGNTPGSELELYNNKIQMRHSKSGQLLLQLNDFFVARVFLMRTFDEAEK